MTQRIPLSFGPVAVYITCLANNLRPEIGAATVGLIESLGFSVDVPLEQTCCGQPSYNGGHQADAAAIAKHQIACLEPFEHIVFPSASCCGMVRNHYPNLLAQSPDWHQRATKIAAKCFELGEFLAFHNWQPESQHPQANANWAYHSSCASLRETRSNAQALSLLARCGIDSPPLPDHEVCCGFGGTFTAKFNAISSRIGINKLDIAAQHSVDHLVSSDLGCLLHLGSLVKTESNPISFLHLSEVLYESL